MRLQTVYGTAGNGSNPVLCKTYPHRSVHLNQFLWVRVFLTDGDLLGRYLRRSLRQIHKKP